MSSGIREEAKVAGGEDPLQIEQVGREGDIRGKEAAYDRERGTSIEGAATARGNRLLHSKGSQNRG